MAEVGQEVAPNLPTDPIPARRRRVGDLACVFCARYGADPMSPPHDASTRCESGKRDHCTCDTCF